MELGELPVFSLSNAAAALTLHHALGFCSVHEVSVAHTPTRVAVKRIDWSTHEQRSSVAKVTHTPAQSIDFISSG